MHNPFTIQRRFNKALAIIEDLQGELSYFQKEAEKNGNLAIGLNMQVQELTKQCSSLGWQALASRVPDKVFVQIIKTQENQGIRYTAHILGPLGHDENKETFYVTHLKDNYYTAPSEEDKIKEHLVNQLMTQLKENVIVELKDQPTMPSKLHINTDYNSYTKVDI